MLAQKVLPRLMCRVFKRPVGDAMGINALKTEIGSLLETESAGRRAFLDDAAGPLQSLAQTLFEAGDRGARLKNFFRGNWLGHPLHPALTDVPVGAWTLGMAMDAIGEERTADRLIGLGVLAAVPTALAGLADWSATEGKARRVGTMHAMLNSVALTGYLGSLLARRSDRRPLGLALATFSFSVAALSAWLGGHLVYNIFMGEASGASETEQPK